MAVIIERLNESGAHRSSRRASFVAALLSIPAAGALQVIVRELRQADAWQEVSDGEPAPELEPAVRAEQASRTGLA